MHSRQLDLDRRRVQTAVSQEIGNLFQAHPTAHHAGCQNVAENVATGEPRLDSGSLQRSNDRDGYGAARDGRTGVASEVLLEHAPIIRARTLLAKVADDCASSVAWKRKNGASACLPCARDRLRCRRMP